MITTLVSAILRGDHAAARKQRAKFESDLAPSNSSRPDAPVVEHRTTKASSTGINVPEVASVVGRVVSEKLNPKPAQVRADNRLGQPMALRVAQLLNLCERASGRPLWFSHVAVQKAAEHFVAEVDVAGLGVGSPAARALRSYMGEGQKDRARALVVTVDAFTEAMRVARGYRGTSVRGMDIANAAATLEADGVEDAVGNVVHVLAAAYDKGAWQTSTVELDVLIEPLFAGQLGDSRLAVALGTATAGAIDAVVQAEGVAHALV